MPNSCPRWTNSNAFSSGKYKKSLRQPCLGPTPKSRWPALPRGTHRLIKFLTLLTCRNFPALYLWPCKQLLVPVVPMVLVVEVAVAEPVPVAVVVPVVVLGKPAPKPGIQSSRQMTTSITGNSRTTSPFPIFLAPIPIFLAPIPRARQTKRCLQQSMSPIIRTMTTEIKMQARERTK